MAQLKKSEKLLMSVAGLAVVALVLNQFVCNDRGSGEQPAAPPQKAEVVPAVKADPKKQAEKSVRVRRQPAAQHAEFRTWGRDPFADAFRLVELDSALSDSSDFVLKGVIRKGDEAHVLIGNTILREGGQIGDLTILEIERNRVVCRKRGKIITLVLRDENTL